MPDSNDFSSQIGFIIDFFFHMLYNCIRAKKMTEESAVKKDRMSYFKKKCCIAEDEILRELSAHAERQIADGYHETMNFSDHCYANMQSGFVNRISNSTFELYHDHDYYEINFVMSGKLYQHLDGTQFMLGEGDFILIPPGVCHTIYAPEDTEAFNLIIAPHFITKTESIFKNIAPGNFLTAMLRRHNYYVFTESKSQLIRALFARMHYLKSIITAPNTAENQFWDCLLETLFRELLLVISTEQVNCYISGTHETGTLSDETIRQYIKSNLATVSIEDVKKHFGLSTMGLYRILNTTGFGYAEYVARLRLSQAKYLLIKSDMSISGIAEAIGLGSAEYFSRFFKKHTQKTPSEYRRMYQAYGHLPPY